MSPMAAVAVVRSFLSLRFVCRFIRLVRFWLRLSLLLVLRLRRFSLPAASNSTSTLCFAPPNTR